MHPTAREAATFLRTELAEKRRSLKKLPEKGKRVLRRTVTGDASTRVRDYVKVYTKAKVQELTYQVATLRVESTLVVSTILKVKLLFQPVGFNFFQPACHYVEVPRVIQTIDKISFVFGVVGLLVTQFVATEFPQVWAAGVYTQFVRVCVRRDYTTLCFSHTHISCTVRSIAASYSWLGDKTESPVYGALESLLQ